MTSELSKEIIEKAVNWLTSSDILVDGGMRSKYDPVTKSYEVWKEGSSDALCTSGLAETLMVYSETFGDDRYDDVLGSSVEHLCGLWDEKKGIMMAGKGSPWIYPLWAGNSVYVLNEYHRKTSHEKSKEIADKITAWLISMQNPDGSIPKNQLWKGKIEPRPVTSWNTAVVRGFLAADTLPAAEKLSRWMLSKQLADGSYYYSFDSINNMYRNFKDRKEHGISVFGAMKNHTLWKHPTSQANCMLAALLMYRKTGDDRLLKSAVRTGNWISANLSPGHIMYEKYYLKGHSVQEDIYPTALFADCLLLLEDIVGDGKHLKQAEGIWRDMISVRFASEDKNLDGAFPGVPLHPTEGGKAYAWDTIGAALSLMRLYKRTV